MFVDLGGTFVNPFLVTSVEECSFKRTSQAEGLNREELIPGVAVHLIGDRKILLEGTDDVSAVAKVLSEEANKLIRSQ